MSKKEPDNAALKIERAVAPSGQISSVEVADIGAIYEVTPHQFTLKGLKALAAEVSFATSGDSVEQENGKLLGQTFPKCEEFWRYLVVPLTNRIHGEVNPETTIQLRPGIGEKIERIAIWHYTLFFNLVQAHRHNEDYSDIKRSCSFEDFYMHMGTALDLSEELCIAVHFLQTRCIGRESTSFQRSSREQFLEMAATWFDKKYENHYDRYLSKGKSMPIYWPFPKGNIAKEYLADSALWKEYDSVAKEIRNYRNSVAHNTQIGRRFRDSALMIPKPDKLKQYDRWSEIAGSKAAEAHDFVAIKDQMQSHLVSAEEVLNKIWTKFINDLCPLLYESRNDLILSEYNLDLSPQPAEPVQPFETVSPNNGESKERTDL
jgi:hypothetical protein